MEINTKENALIVETDDFVRAPREEVGGARETITLSLEDLDRASREQIYSSVNIGDVLLITYWYDSIEDDRVVVDSVSRYADGNHYDEWVVRFLNLFR